MVGRFGVLKQALIMYYDSAMYEGVERKNWEETK